MTHFDPQLRRFVVESNLDNTLNLWLDAISRGDYEAAKKILDARNALRAELEKLRTDHDEASD
jgi:hypothetical protein